MAGHQQAWHGADRMTHFLCPQCRGQINTLRLRRNGHFTDDIFKHIFFNENV